MIDVAAATADYMLARDFPHARGHRVCLEGVTPQSVGCSISAASASTWSSSRGGLRPRIRTWRSGATTALVRQIGEARVILCRCGDAMALESGHALGTTLLQERQIDTLLEAAQKGPLFRVPA